MRIMIKYLRHNIKVFYTREKFIFSLIILCAFLTGIMIPFIDGIYCNFMEKVKSQDNGLILLYITFENDPANQRYADKKLIESCLEEFPEEIMKEVKMFFASFRDEEGSLVECRFTMRQQEYYPCTVYRDNLVRFDDLNGYFTEEDEKRGNPVVVVPQESGNIGDKLWIYGKNFTIVGTYDGAGGTGRKFIPFAAIEEDAVLEDTGFVIAFYQPVTKKQYDTIKKIMESKTEGMAIMPDMPMLDQYRRSLYNTVLMVTALIGFSISLNFLIIYQYIWKQRKRQMAIFMVCGMDKRRLFCLLMSEYITMILPSIMLGMIVFHIAVRPIVQWMLPYLKNSYLIGSYFTMLLIFTGISVLLFGMDFLMIIKRCRIRDMLWE